MIRLYTQIVPFEVATHETPTAQIIEDDFDVRIQTVAICAFISLTSLIGNRVFIHRFRGMRDDARLRNDVAAVRRHTAQLLFAIVMEGVNLMYAAKNFKILSNFIYSDSKKKETKLVGVE